MAEKHGDEWVVLEWVKKAILLYFDCRDGAGRGRPVHVRRQGALKRFGAESRVRVVPPAVARYGSFLSDDVVLMPSYVDIGAWVGPRTMVDTWATVGSCAQIGADVHLAGGVGIGGVLEPVQARPVIVEDGAFLGSRCIVTEGVVIGEEAVLAPNVSLTATVPVLDVTGAEVVEHRGYVPPRSVVVPGTRAREFAAGTFQVACALIIGAEASPQTAREPQRRLASVRDRRLGRLGKGVGRQRARPRCASRAKPGFGGGELALPEPRRAKSRLLLRR